MNQKPNVSYDHMNNPQMDQPPPVLSQPEYPPPTYQPQHELPQQQGFPSQQPGFSQQQQTSTNVVVVNQQPQMLGPKPWSSGMCACFEDIGSCCLGYFCPCFLLFDVSQRMGEGCCFPYCCPGSLLGLRIKLRIEQNIQGSLMDDYCVVCCFPLCVLCQLSRELKATGR